VSIWSLRKPPLLTGTSLLKIRTVSCLRIAKPLKS
jgi:hypothetical protein